MGGQGERATGHLPGQQDDWHLDGGGVMMVLAMGLAMNRGRGR
jgi:hypothetical protein